VVPDHPQCVSDLKIATAVSY